MKAQTIEVTELAAPAPGLTTTASAGLYENLWDKTPYETWEVLLGDLPGTITSPTLRTWLLNALLSNASIPSGDISPAAQQDTRTQALLPYVDAATYDKYVNTVPTPERTTLHFATQRELAFAERGAGACTTLPADSATVNDMLWRLYCTLANTNDENRYAGAQLQVDLLRERGDQAGAEVALIDNLIAQANGSTDPIPLPVSASVLTLRLLSLGKNQPLNVGGNNPLVMRARQFVLMERGGVEGAEAAEWLTARGITTSDNLASAYEAVPFTDAERADAEFAGRLTGARQRAYIWQQLQDAETSEERLRSLNDFITNCGIDAVTGARGQLLLPYLFEITASAENAWAGPNLFALAANQSQHTLLNNWYETVANVAETLPDAQKWMTRLWPLALALELDRVDIARLSTWIAIAQTQPGIERVPVADVLTILEAAGFPIPAETWAQVTDTPTAGAPGLVNAKRLESLRAAAAANNQGEVILRAATVLDGKVGDQPPPVTAAVIRAFADVQLPDAARALTIEALLNLLYPSTN